MYNIFPKVLLFNLYLTATPIFGKTNVLKFFNRHEMQDAVTLSRGLFSLLVAAYFNVLLENQGFWMTVMKCRQFER